MSRKILAALLVAGAALSAAFAQAATPATLLEQLSQTDGYTPVASTPAEVQPAASTPAALRDFLRQLAQSDGVQG